MKKRFRCILTLVKALGAGLICLISATMLGRISMLLLGLPLLLGALLASRGFPEWKHPIHVILVLAYVALALSPLDVQLQAQGAPHVRYRRIEYGTPTAEGWKSINQGDVIWGGCVVSWNQPTHALVLSS
jgi:hypothetical protein